MLVSMRYFFVNVYILGSLAVPEKHVSFPLLSDITHRQAFIGMFLSLLYHKTIIIRKRLLLLYDIKILEIAESYALRRGGKAGSV